MSHRIDFIIHSYILLINDLKFCLILTKSCLSKFVIFSTMLHNHRLNFISFSPLSLDSSLNVVYEINVLTLISPTPFKSNRKSSAVKKSNAPLGSTSNTPDRIAYEIQKMFDFK